MIERVVLFKLDGEWTEPARRAEVAAESRARLGRCLGVRALSIGVPADPAAEKSWDLSIVLRFDDLAAYERFRDDPTHRAYVDEYIAPKMELVKAWNFETLAP
jgi:hypothetical protein